MDIQIQTPNTEEVIKHLDSLVHLCTGEEGGLSSSQDEMGEGSISAEDTMTKDSESSLQKLWDDEQMLVSPGSHVEVSLPCLLMKRKAVFSVFGELGRFSSSPLFAYSWRWRHACDEQIRGDFFIAMGSYVGGLLALGFAYGDFMCGLFAN